MTFASVVLAIGLTEVFGGWGRLIRSGLPVRWYPLWVAWSAYLVILTIQYWSGIWPYRDASFAEGYKVVWLALPTFTVIILSYLFSPDPLSDECVDLEERYWKAAPRAFPLFGITLGLAMAADYIVIGHFTGGTEAKTLGLVSQQAALILLLVLAGYWKRPIFHWFVLAICLIGPAYFLLGMLNLFQ